MQKHPHLDLATINDLKRARHVEINGVRAYKKDIKDFDEDYGHYESVFTVTNGQGNAPYYGMYITIIFLNCGEQLLMFLEPNHPEGFFMFIDFNETTQSFIRYQHDPEQPYLSISRV